MRTLGFAVSAIGVACAFGLATAYLVLMLGGAL